MAFTNLPSLPYQDGIRKAVTQIFGGYDHNIGAGDGTIWDEENMTADYYPVMGTRAPRYTVGTLTAPRSLYALNGLWWVDGTKLYHDGYEICTVQANQKQFAAMGDRLLVWPDKIVVYTGDTLISWAQLESTAAGLTCSIQDGTYAGEEAEKNTIYSAGTSWGNYFKIGDAVTITGASTAANNKTAIVREIDGAYLRFYENTFAAAESGVTLTLTREVPDLDFICVNENRCWGCKGDTIYASKLGDPTNWNVFDGVSTDSYAVETGTEGSFTACCAYLGYPIFFKEERIFKVYGSKPSAFQVMGSATLGVQAGSSRSLAIAGETLYYLSRAGVVAYAGGIPESISTAFGTERYKNGVGGSDGLKYRISMQDVAGQWHLFCWDTRRALWHREDGTHALDFAFSNGEIWMLEAGGALKGLGNLAPASGSTAETGMESFVESNDFTGAYSSRTVTEANRKGTAKLQLRGEIGADAVLIVRIRFDSVGKWETVSVLKSTVKRSWYLPIIPRRSDHYRLRLEGVGEWRLYSLVRENYSGSEI